MELNIALLKKQKILVATPMYGGQCHGIYAESCARLAKLAALNGIQIDFFYMYNESLITRGRNNCAHAFLRSDATHLMFIDSDIGFEPADVLALVAIAEDDSDKHIVCGPYARKGISWDQVKKAVEKGCADQDPNELRRYTGNFVFNTVSGETAIKLKEPVEVQEAGTGFMVIRRDTLEHFKTVYPDLTCYLDHSAKSYFKDDDKHHVFFDTVIDPESGRYLSEDYMFCQYARRAGLKVWLCPWMKLRHMGAYEFGGSLPDLAKLMS